MIKPVKTAVFPVGGLGTRFLPATKSIPKEMLTVVDRPLIQYAFEEARAAGIERFIFITGRNKNAISNHFDYNYELDDTLKAKGKTDLLEKAIGWMPPAGSIAYVRQQEPMGLGHAILCARKFVGDEPFVVLLADEMMLSEKPFITTMIEYYQKLGGNVLGVADVPLEEVSRYGIIDPGQDDGDVVSVAGMVEKPSPDIAPSQISITGQYILQPEIFNVLETQKTGAGGEIQLTDALKTMVRTTPCHGVRFQGERYDCGNRRGFLQANIAYALRQKDIRDDVMNILKSFVDR